MTDLGPGVVTAPRLAGRDALASRFVRLVTLRFPPGNLAAFQGEEYTVVIEVDDASGRDVLPHHQNRRKLNRYLKAAIEEALRHP